MGTIWKKKKQNEAEREKKRKDERKVLTLTGLLMEGVSTVPNLYVIFDDSVRCRGVI
jgi:adenylylsulfate kinase-like enzyme